MFTKLPFGSGVVSVTLTVISPPKLLMGPLRTKPSSAIPMVVTPV